MSEENTETHSQNIDSVTKDEEWENSEEAAKLHADIRREETERVNRLKTALLDPNSTLPDSSIADEITGLSEISDDLRRDQDLPSEEREQKMASMAHRILEKEHLEHHPKGRYDPKDGEQSYFYEILSQRGIVPLPPKEPLIKRVARGAKDYAREYGRAFKATNEAGAAAVKGTIKETLGKK